MQNGHFADPEKPKKEAPETAPDILSLKKDIENWQNDRVKAEGFSAKFDQNGWDYETTSELQGGFSDVFGYAPFLQKMMQNFDQWHIVTGDGEKRSELAKSSVEKVRDNLTKLEKQL